MVRDMSFREGQPIISEINERPGRWLVVSRPLQGP